MKRFRSSLHCSRQLSLYFIHLREHFCVQLTNKKKATPRRQKKTEILHLYGLYVENKWLQQFANAIVCAYVRARVCVCVCMFNMQK